MPNPRAMVLRELNERRASAARCTFDRAKRSVVAADEIQLIPLGPPGEPVSAGPNSRWLLSVCDEQCGHIGVLQRDRTGEHVADQVERIVARVDRKAARTAERH